MDDRVISIIFTFHNGGTALQSALEKLRDLAETGAVECIIVNDGSTDRSADVVSYFMALNPEFDRHSTTATMHFQQGTSAAFGEGLKLAKAPYVMTAGINAIPSVADIELFADAASRGEADVITTQLSHPDADLNNLSIMGGDLMLYGKLLRRSLVENDFKTPIIMADGWHHVSICARALARSQSTVQLPINNRQQKLLKNDKAVAEHLVLAMLIEKWFAEQGLADRYSPFLDQVKFLAKLPLLTGTTRDRIRWRETFPEVNSRLLDIPGISKRYLIRARLALGK